MGLLSNLKSALGNKRNHLGKVNTFLTNDEWAKTQRRLDELDAEAEQIFMFDRQVMEHKDICKSEVENYQADVIGIKADYTAEISEATKMVNYADVKNAAEFKEVSTGAVRKAENANDKAKAEMDKAKVSVLKKIADKLKSFGVKKENAGIDLRSAYEAKDPEKTLRDVEEEYKKMHNNIAILHEETVQRANREGQIKVRSGMIASLSGMEKNARTVQESQEFRSFLKSLPLEQLAKINKKLVDAQIGNMLEADGQPRNAVVTAAQLEMQRQKVQELKDDVNDRIGLAKQALDSQRNSVKAFDEIRNNSKIRESYVVVDMQSLGLRAREVIARKDCIVMMSQTMQEEALANNGKPSHPAVIIVNHDGGVQCYDNFEQCDAARNIGLTNPQTMQTLLTEGMVQNNDYFQNGYVEAYVNCVRDMIQKKDKEQVLYNEYTRMTRNFDNGIATSHAYQDYQQMAEDRKRAEALSNYLFDDNFDFIKDASSQVQNALFPLVNSIKREMEEREANDHNQLLTGQKLRDKTHLIEGENGKEFAPVLVLSATMTAKDGRGNEIHPTVNIVCDEQGQFKAAYYSEEYHDASMAYLGERIGDREHGIEYSIYSNNPTVRQFMDSYPSIKAEIEENCSLEKFYEDRDISLEDIQQINKEVVQEELGG